MVLIALGANLPGPDAASPLETCRRAAARLDALDGFRLRGLSRWWETAPVPPSGQPNYVNAVAHLEQPGQVPTDPEGLLRRLQAIEHELGRVRGERNAARTLDLDLIAWDGLVRDAPDPVLPHPRAHERAFVLAPLSEVAPRWVHPRLGATAAALLAALPAQGFRPL